MAKDTVNGFSALLSIPDSFDRGTISMKIPRLANGARLTIWARNVRDRLTVLQIYKSVLFAGSDTSRNPPLADSKFLDRTNVEGTTVFLNNCAKCHSLSKDMEGPRLQDLMAMRSMDWIYRFFVDSKQIAGDTIHEKLKKAFNNLECPEFKNLTRADIVGVVYYIEYEQP
jgi:hypothetical protein